MNEYEVKKNYFLSLLECSYMEVVSLLLEKYGVAQYDYFSEYSYKRYLQGKIKSLSSSGKTSRTSEGLYVHHIDENIYINMSYAPNIKSQKIPFSNQKKDRLVYCDIIEHLILHALIAKETKMKFGIHGYEIFILPQICHWYIYEKKDNYRFGSPNAPWLNHVYYKAFLPPKEALELIDSISIFLYGEERDISYYEINETERNESFRIASQKEIEKREREEVIAYEKLIVETRIIPTSQTQIISA